MNKNQDFDKNSQGKYDTTPKKGNFNCSILEAGLRLQKIFYLGPDGEIKKQELKIPRKFNIRGITIRDIFDIEKLVDEISKNKFKAIVRGVTGHSFVTNSLRNQKTLFEPAGGIPWICIDADNIICSDGVDPNTVEGIILFIHLYLPKSFHDVSFYYQFSSSAGLIGPNRKLYKEELNVHIFFYLSRPVTRRELEDWLKDCNCIDKTLFRPEQIHLNRSTICGCNKLP